MHRDNDGNTLAIWRDGVYLQLKGEQRPRKILELAGRNRVIKRVLKKNVMRKPVPSIGFNYHALKMIALEPRLKDVKINILYKSKTYVVTPSQVIDDGEFFHYKKEGFELQVFYPIEKLEESN